MVDIEEGDLDDIWLFKADADGEIIYQKIHSFQHREILTDLIITSDGSIVTLGYTRSFSFPESDAFSIFVVKFNSEGEIIWNFPYGAYNSPIIDAMNITETQEGNYLIAGTSYTDPIYSNDYFLMQLDTEGNILHERNFAYENTDYAHQIIKTSDGHYVLCGNTNYQCNGLGNSCAFLLKINDMGDLSSTDEQKIEDKLVIYPNPSFGHFKIKLPDEIYSDGILKIFTLTGKEVLSVNTINSNIFDINLSQQPAGTYIIQIITEKIRTNKKLIIVK